jgi:hypothetical protein
MIKIALCILAMISLNSYAVNISNNISDLSKKIITTDSRFQLTLRDSKGASAGREQYLRGDVRQRKTRPHQLLLRDKERSSLVVRIFNLTPQEYNELLEPMKKSQAYKNVSIAIEYKIDLESNKGDLEEISFTNN